MAKLPIPFRLKDYRLICSDWSGVVSDDVDLALEVDNRMLIDSGKPPLEMGEFRSLDTASPLEFQRRMGLEGSDRELWERYEKYLYQVLSEGMAPQILPGAAYTLSHLNKRRRRVVVISNHPRSQIESEADRYGIRKHISLIFGGQDEKAGAIMEAFKHYGISPKDTLFLGDMKADIRAGKEAGVYTAGICTGYHCRAFLESEEPDFIFDTIFDVVVPRF